MTGSNISDREDAASAYEGAAQLWDEGPSRLYNRLARLLVDDFPMPLGGLRVLDIGAGTGAVSRALIDRGAHPHAVDSADDMIQRAKLHGIPGTVANMLALPFDDESFDCAVAGFSISHVAEPVLALAEARRVIREGGAVAVAVFAARASDDSKETVDAVATRFGFEPPRWYTRFKLEIEPLTNTPGALRSCAAAAGLTSVVITERVATGIDTPEDIVASRLGMAHYVPFVQSLSGEGRRQLYTTAIDAVREHPASLRPAVLIMTGFRGGF
jgi:ubiquinone/menaquinone biosynthesis C-methylase UbiE